MELDRNMIAILDQIPISFQVVFTKLDFVFDSTYYRVWKETEKELSEISKTCYPELLGTSAKKNIGIETLALSILRVCKPTDN
jgi:GTP-binding protein EngB required for normal cell division